MKNGLFTLKRYQYYTKEGITWTKWFPCRDTGEHWQLKNKLKNEYKVVS